MVTKWVERVGGEGVATGCVASESSQCISELVGEWVSK